MKTGGQPAGPGTHGFTFVLKTTLHVNLLLCLSCGPETQVLYLPSPPATKVNPGDTFVPILGALSHLLWTLPARLVSFQAPPGFPPFVSQHSCLPSVFNDGIWSPRPNFWKSLRAVCPPTLCFNLKVPCIVTPSVPHISLIF